MGRKALIIGIDDYQTAPLHGCVNDAKEIASLLKTNEDESKNFDVRLELNIQKKEKLSDAIQSLFTGDDEIVFFWTWNNKRRRGVSLHSRLHP